MSAGEKGIMHAMPEPDLDGCDDDDALAVPATAADLDKMLDKIRKLLAMAEDESLSKPAADSYNAKAARLMSKYGVDRAMLAAVDPSSDTVGNRIITIHAPYALDKDILLNMVCGALGVRAHYKRRDSASREVHLIGMDSDLVRVDMLFTSLLVQSARELSRQSCPPHTSKVTFVKSFLDGYTTAVRIRLERAEAHARQQAEQQHRRSGHDGPSVELVLVSRAERVEQAYRAAYPRARQGRPRAPLHRWSVCWHPGQRPRRPGRRPRRSQYHRDRPRRRASRMMAAAPSGRSTGHRAIVSHCGFIMIAMCSAGTLVCST